MASGSPSRRQQISTTAAALPSLSLKSGLTAAARCMNRDMAEYCGNTSRGGKDLKSGSSSGGTGNSCSSYTRRAARLVTRSLRLGAAAISSVSIGAAASTCSKLSISRSIGALRELLKYSFNVSNCGRPPISRTPSVWAITLAIELGSLTAASATK